MKKHKNQSKTSKMTKTTKNNKNQYNQKYTKIIFQIKNYRNTIFDNMMKLDI